MDIGDIVYEKLTNICFFAETNLDDTFNQNSLNTHDYKTCRKDRNSTGGGIIAYVRSNLPIRHIETCKRPRVRSPRSAHSFVETWS